MFFNLQLENVLLGMLWHFLQYKQHQSQQIWNILCAKNIYSKLTFSAYITANLQITKTFLVYQIKYH